MNKRIIKRIVRTLCAYLMCLCAPAIWASQTPVADQVQHWVSPKGAQVYLMRNAHIPMVDVRVTFDAGSSRDKREGVANFTQAMLSAGVYPQGKQKALSEDELSDALDALGAQLGGGVSKDSASMSLRSLSDADKLWPAVELYSRVLNTPSFPKKVMQRDQPRLVRALGNRQTQPAGMVHLLFNKALYGTHPYAHAVSGSETSVANITRLHLKQFHKTYYVAQNAVIAIVGDVNREQAQNMVQIITRDMPKGKKPNPIHTAFPDLTSMASLGAACQTWDSGAKDCQRRVLQVPMKTQQAHVLMGQLGLTLNDPDYYDLYVADYIFGRGGFSSILVKSIRKEQGLAYSVYSHMGQAIGRGAFVMGMQTQVKHVDKALALLEQELMRFANQGPTQEQLDQAKQHILGSTPMRTDSNAKWVGFLSSVGRYGWSLDYLDTFNAHIEQVTVQSMQNAWKKHVKRHNMITVVVGGSTQVNTLRKGAK